MSKDTRRDLLRDRQDDGLHSPAYVAQGQLIADIHEWIESDKVHKAKGKDRDRKLQLNKAYVEITRLRMQYAKAAGLLQDCIDDLPFADADKCLSDEIVYFLKDQAKYAHWVQGGQSEVVPL